MRYQLTASCFDYGRCQQQSIDQATLVATGQNPLGGSVIILDLKHSSSIHC